jgi:hypothetical protein
MSLIGFISSLVIGGTAILLWWPLAWDWDSDGLSIPAYMDRVVVIVSAVTGVISGIVMIISAAKAGLSHERKTV